MADMPFYKRIGFTLALVSVCGILITGLISMVYMTKSSKAVTDEMIGMQSKNALATMDAIFNHYKLESKIAAENLSQDRHIAKAFERRDLDTLRNTARQIVGHTDLNVNFITFLDKDGDVVARTHRDRVGDSLAYQKNFMHALRGDVSTHVEYGTEIKLSVRSGAPIRDDAGDIIGVVSTGYSLDDPLFVSRMKDMTGNEFAVFIDDVRMSTTVGSDPDRAVGTRLDPKIAELVLEDREIYIGEGDVRGTRHVLAYRPILDFEGRPAGVFAAGISVEGINSLRQRAVGNAIIMELGFMTLIIGIFLFFVRRTITKPLSNMAKAATAISQGSLDIKIEHESKDELGLLAKALRTMVSELRGYIEDLRLREEELTTALDKAEHAEVAKSQFLANMSHEIRTPMNIIIGIAHLALKIEMTPKLQEYIQRIHKSTTFLLEMINEILDFSKLESGAMMVENTAFDLEEVVEGGIGLIGWQAEEKGLEFVCKISPKIPRRIVGDPLRLSEILANLVGNAVKFTEKGKVSVDVLLVDRSADRVKLRFSVRDTGIGIPKEQQEHMFEAFRQGDSSTTRQYGGTGLGLAICKSFVELMGGALEFISEPGIGSAFVFIIEFDVADDGDDRRESDEEDFASGETDPCRQYRAEVLDRDRQLSGAVNVRMIEGLLCLLGESDMEALDVFEDASEELKHCMGRANYNALKHSIARLEFSKASNILKRVFLVE